MSFRPIPKNKYIRWLKFKGLVYIRTSASHELWDSLDGAYDRPITFRTMDKDIPPLHLKSNCDTMGVSMKDLYKEIQRL